MFYARLVSGLKTGGKKPSRSTNSRSKILMAVMCRWTNTSKQAAVCRKSPQMLMTDNQAPDV